MANPTTNFGWVMPTSTDLVTDLPADFAVFGQAVDTSMADLKGGTTGQILAKATNTDMDFTWITNDQGDITEVNTTAPLAGGGTSGALTLSIAAATTSVVGAVQLSDSTSTTSSVLAATPTAVKSAYDLANGAIAKTTVTTAGDIIYRNATVPTRLGIGTAGQVLTVNTGATAPEWKTPSGGGKILQVVNTTVAASRSTTSATAVDITGASATITPSAVTSTILVLANAAGSYASTTGGGTCYGAISTVRGSTVINSTRTGKYVSSGTGGTLIGDVYTGTTEITYDSPATTSATTYKLTFQLVAGTTMYASDGSGYPISLTLIEIGA
jgi:hypothetical protein